MIRTLALMTLAAAGTALAGGGSPAPSPAKPTYVLPANPAPARTPAAKPVQASAPAPAAATAPAPSQPANASSSAFDALIMLQSGNDRFVAGQPTHPNSDSGRREDTSANGQKPFAVILACADSRVPVEQIFDRGIGDIFVIRVAGNICDTAQSATIEYGLEHLAAPLLVVMGHSNCGAVSAAASGANFEGPLGALLAHITPAVENAKRVYPDRAGPALVQDAIRFNVWQSIESLLKSNANVRNLASSGKSKIVGAVYDTGTGRVQWMGEAPMQGAVLAASSQETPSVPTAVRKPVSGPATANAAPANERQ